MGFLNNTTVTVDAILTKKGRELLAKGGNAFILLKPLKHKGLKLLRIEGRSVDLVAEGEDNELTLRLMLSRCVSR